LLPSGTGVVPIEDVEGATAIAAWADGGRVTTGTATEAAGEEEEELSEAWLPNSESRNSTAASAAVAAATSHNHLPARPVPAGLMSSSSCGPAIARGREDADVGRPEGRLTCVSVRTFGNGSRMMRVAPDCPEWA